MEYDVLPQRLGLIQLIKTGAITTANDGFYRIVKPIARFPAGLNGGYRVNFLLAKGVPMPAGSAGHSDVWSEETGECLSGVLCR